MNHDSQSEEDLESIFEKAIDDGGLELSNVEVLQLAYATRRALVPVIKENSEFPRTQVNGLKGAYYTVRDLLDCVNERLLEKHAEVTWFFLNNFELYGPGTRLVWKDQYRNEVDYRLVPFMPRSSERNPWDNSVNESMETESQKDLPF